MAQFITGNKLNLEIEQILKNAKETIVLISPFIKLHSRYEAELRAKLDNPNIEIIIVFGKNAEQMQKSMQYADFAFFKEFPNIEIRFEKNLHAKYYANEKTAVLTSMNLYSYSQDNNIEAGVITTNSFRTKATNLVVGGLVDDVDEDAWEYFARVVKQAEILYEKKPEFEDKLFGLTKKYLHSKVKIDKLSEFFEKLNSKVNAKAVEQRQYFGYCIRTGVQIPFNLELPFCNQSWRSWSQFRNENYQENYCHFSGEPSYGQTCYAKPILHQNWKKAAEKIKATSLTM
jgi:hypothetical protein